MFAIGRIAVRCKSPTTSYPTTSWHGFRLLLESQVNCYFNFLELDVFNLKNGTSPGSVNYNFGQILRVNLVNQRVGITFVAGNFQESERNGPSVSGLEGKSAKNIHNQLPHIPVIIFGHIGNNGETRGHSF